MFSLFVLCLMAELIAIAAQGVRIACMLPCISEATAAQRCICNVKFCHIRFASSQTFQVVNCGDHRDLHWCTRTFAWLKCMHIAKPTFEHCSVHNEAVVFDHFMFVFGVCSGAGNRGLYMRAAVHAHAHAHICYEA